MKSEEVVKITFRVDPDRSEGMVSETLWAERVGADRFRLANVPLYVRGVSHRDIVFGRRGRYGVLMFRGVSIRGGHSTCRMIRRVGRGSAEFRARLEQLQEAGCGYEGGLGHSLGIDVPPSVDLDAVLERLDAGAAAGLWEYEVAHRGHAAGTVRSSS